MNLAVRLYANAPSNPMGIPSTWPESVIQLGESTTLPDETYQLMTEEELSAYRSTHQSEYDAWYLPFIAALPVMQSQPSRVQPTVIYNEHLLIPYGMKKGKFVASDYCASITLSNRSGDTFDYSCVLEPKSEGYIVQNDVVVRVEIEEVDVENGKLTVKEGQGELISLEDAALLSNPFIIDCEVPQVSDLVYLWGLTFQARNFNEDDFMCLRVMMPSENGLVSIKEYEETWVSNINKRGVMNTPDGSPGELPIGLIMRMEYHPVVSDSKVIHVNYDFIFTVKA